jgi:ribosomal protein S6--L-glutamate ligase
MILSFHPTLAADHNRLLVSQRPLNPGDVAAVCRAQAVLLPQICRRDLYTLVAGLGVPHFPRQGARLAFDGKVGNHHLFSALNLPQPRTTAFASLQDALHAWQEGRLDAAGLKPPLVAKGAGGGMGDNVFLVRSPQELAALQTRLETYCAWGPPGLVLQELVPTDGRDLRVIILGSWRDAFWRVGPPGEFRANLSRGGRIVRDQDPQALAAALNLAEHLAKAVGLDVAAVDMLMHPQRGPLLLEINHYFGREALGGSEAFLRLYLQQVQSWLESQGLDPARVRLDT